MSYTNKKLVRDIEIDNGSMGIEARVDISRDTVIGIYDGKIIRIPIINNRIQETTTLHRGVVQIFRDENSLFGLITPEGEPLYGIDLINHSCRPNIGFRDRIILYTLRDIRAGEPLTMDYRKWDFIPEGIQCWCKEPRCHI